MYTNGLKDKYGKLLNCGIDSVEVINNSSSISITPSITDDTHLKLQVDEGEETIGELIIKNNNFFTLVKGNTNEVYNTTTDLYVGLDCHEKNGVMMMATANGIIKSTNGVDWRQTDLELPCQSIHGVGNKTWYAGGYRKNTSTSGGNAYHGTYMNVKTGAITVGYGNAVYVKDNSACWRSDDNGLTWKIIPFFKNKKLTPWTITSMPHPKNPDDEKYNYVLFGCSGGGGLVVRHYNTKRGKYKFTKVPEFEGKSVMSLYYHEKSGWLFAGTARGGVTIDSVYGSLWMTKDLSTWYCAFTTTEAIRNIIVADYDRLDTETGEYTSYVYCSSPNVSYLMAYNLDELINEVRSYYDGRGGTLPHLWNTVTCMPTSLNTSTDRSCKIRCTDGSETVAFAHSGGVGLVNTSDPYNEYIIHNSTQAGTAVSYPYCICVNQNGRFSVGSQFTVAYDSNNVDYPPSYHYVMNSANNVRYKMWDTWTNNKYNGMYGIMDIGAEGSYYIYSRYYYSTIEGQVTTGNNNNENGSTNIGSGPDAEFEAMYGNGIHNADIVASLGNADCYCKRITEQQTIDFTEHESTHLISSKTHSGTSSGSSIANYAHATYFSIGLQHNNGWDGGNITYDQNGFTDTHPILCATSDVGTRGFKNTGWYNNKKLTEWSISCAIMVGGSTSNEYFNIFNTRGAGDTRMGLGLAVNPSTQKLAVVWNWDEEREYLCEIHYELAHRFILGVEGGKVYIFSMATGGTNHSASADVSGYETDLFVGSFESDNTVNCFGESFWCSNSGSNHLCPANNILVDVDAMKRFYPNFDFVSSLNDNQNLHFYQTTTSNISRSVIGVDYISKDTVTGDFFNTIYHEPSDKWYSANDINGLKSSTTDGNSWANSSSSLRFDNAELKPVKDHVGYIYIDYMSDGGYTTSFQMWNPSSSSTITTANTSCVRHVNYLDEIDCVVTSGGQGNVVQTYSNFKVYPYSNFISTTSDSTQFRNLMADVDLTTYLPSDFYAIKGENTQKYIYCCFYNRDTNTYDINRLAFEDITAAINNEPIENPITGEIEETTDFNITMDRWENILSSSNFGWKNSEACVLNDIAEGYAFYFPHNGSIYKLGAFSGIIHKLNLKGDTDLGHIYKLTTNDEGNVLYACTDNGLFLIDTNTSFTTGADTVKKLQNILSKLGIEEQ